MADQQINKIATPVSENEMVNAFKVAAQELFNLSLSQKQLGIIVAQNNLETGSRKYMFNYNIGNITHVSGDGHDFFIGGDKTRNSKGEWVPTHPKFRAYPDLLSGAKDYLKNLSHRGNGIVWKAVLAEDPVGFSKALKKTKYYEADEEDTIDKKTGKKVPGYTSSLLTHYNNFTKNKSMQNPETDNLSKIDNLLNSFMGIIAYDERFIKKCAYKNNLLPNEILIKINAPSFEDAVEFSRILCAALDEEIYTDAQVHTDKKNVEVFCTVYGPKSLSIKAVQELCSLLSYSFEEATSKIGGIKVQSIICPNKKPDYQELDIKLAQMCYNNFHLKFI